jgi:3-hydroxyacyl-[acyl-carrier-protein] dehydratase
MNGLDIFEIRKILPHRYPILMIDRIIDIDPWEFAIAIKNVSVNEAYFNGHFPKYPIMPGVLIVEAVAQTINVLHKYRNPGKPEKDYNIVLGAIKSRFKSSVHPGDQMVIHAKAVKFISSGGVATGEVCVDGKQVCTAEISFATTDSFVNREAIDE